MVSKKELAQRLFDTAETRARLHGVRFGDGAGADLRQMTQKAAQTILESARKKPAEAGEEYVRAASRVAVEALETFVDQMAIGRVRIPGYLAARGNVIGEETFKRARGILCPLWPIC